jgi:hypothetical protein
MSTINHNEPIPCAYGCGTMMDPAHAEGGIHYQFHKANGDLRLELHGAIQTIKRSTS